MKYDDLLKSTNEDVTLIILTAMAYFSQLSKEPLYILYKNGSKPIKMTNNDLVNLSIFLSILSADNHISAIHQKNGITHNKILKTIDCKKIKLDTLTREEYASLYNKHFKKVIDKAIYLANNLHTSTSYIDYSIYSLYAFIAKHQASGSDIVLETMYKSGLGLETIQDLYDDIINFEYLCRNKDISRTEMVKQYSYIDDDIIDEEPGKVIYLSAFPRKR